MGIGHDAGAATIYAGGARWTAHTNGTRPQPITADPSSALGAGLAVTLAAGYIFRAAIGLPAVADRGISLWALAPAAEPTGPVSFGPVAVGSAWLVGAGAVGSCLAWWLQFTGVDGAWTVIDGDIADDTNLNRSLGLFAAHTGTGGQEPVPKSDAAAALIPGAVSYPRWWEDWAATGPEPPDVLIPVANEHGIRPAIAAYGHPAAIQATTSRDWTAELHRHLPGQDGCIACRLPEHSPAFACATGASRPAGHDPGRDAALPFLSAAAGILLLSGLLQLQHGRWHAHDRNHWRLWFDQSPRPVQSSRWLCGRSCRYAPVPAVRHAIHGATRWYRTGSSTGSCPAVDHCRQPGRRGTAHDLRHRPAGASRVRAGPAAQVAAEDADVSSARRPGGRPGGQGDPVPGRCRQDGRRCLTGRGGAGGAEPGDRASSFPPRIS